MYYRFRTPVKEALHSPLVGRVNISKLTMAAPLSRIVAKVRQYIHSLLL